MNNKRQKKIRPRTNKKIHITTLGCSKNTYDSEVLAGQLNARKANLVEEPEAADVIVINTCGFIEMAKQESIDAILEAEQIKKEDPSKKVIVCGCMTERYADQIREEIPGIDGIFGTEAYEDILTYLDYDPKLSPEYLYEKRVLATPSHYAYLKISEGCNHTCSFCAIPLMRGRHRSRPMPQIIEEARLLAQQGVKELIIISQDTTFYGLDLYRSQKIVDLLQELEDIDGIEWIRLHYLYPTTVQDSLIDFMAASSKIVPYLDMPIQHVSDPMLKIMKRGGKSQRIRSIFEQAKSKIQDVTLRTTLIVGHPGETESDFAALKKFVEEFQFDRVGVFTYSHEENTSAFQLEDLPAPLKQERYNELMEIQQSISLEKNLAKIGRNFQVLVDEADWSTLTAYGRTTGDSPEIDNEVVIESLGKAVKAGDFLSVDINDATEYELYGKIRG